MKTIGEKLTELADELRKNSAGQTKPRRKFQLYTDDELRRLYPHVKPMKTEPEIPWDATAGEGEI